MEKEKGKRKIDYCNLRTRHIFILKEIIEAKALETGKTKFISETLNMLGINEWKPSFRGNSTENLLQWELPGNYFLTGQKVIPTTAHFVNGIAAKSPRTNDNSLSTF